MKLLSLCTVVVLIGALFAPSSAAMIGDPIPMPPSGLEVEYDELNQTATLRWEPPVEPGEYSYNVYRNGSWVATVDTPEYSEILEPHPSTGEVVAFYFVTTVHKDTNLESSPTDPVFVMSVTPCELVIIVVNPNSTIPVSVGVNEACQERWERTVENRIKELVGEDIWNLISPPDPEEIIGDNLGLL